MTGPEDEFGADYWEGRYRGGEGAGRSDPSPSLVTEAGGLAPGRALDAGCGTGADALWLASRGWHVTAVDVSATALSAARATARTAGSGVADRVEWVCVDLTAWDPGERSFDLVTCHYVHVPGPVEDLFRRLASWVAPSGTLLVVGHGHAPAGDGPAVHRHGDHDGADGGGHEHPASAQIRPEQVTAGLGQDRWDVRVAESRTRAVSRPDGADGSTLHDAVVRAQRRDPSSP